MTTTGSIYADRIIKYGNQTSAEALFFHSSIKHDVKGLRVLLTEKGLEFSDRSYIGTDPAGFFYYYNLDEAQTADKYEADTIINPRDNQLCAWVKFYNDSNPSKIIGEFLGNDYFGAVDLAGMKGHTHWGKWGESSAHSYVEAHLKKDANSATVTLDISNALDKIATMTTHDSNLKESSISDISGNFHYDTLDKIKNGTYVSYTNDRLVFYEDDIRGASFTGYFIPNGRSETAIILGIPRNAELTLEGTVWEDLRF